MDKDGMYVVHDVVDDYPDLASIFLFEKKLMFGFKSQK